MCVDRCGDDDSATLNRLVEKHMPRAFGLALRLAQRPVVRRRRPPGGVSPCAGQRRDV